MTNIYRKRNQTKTVEENLELVKGSMAVDHQTGRRERCESCDEKLPDVVRTGSVAGQTEPDDNTKDLETGI